jgi:superfamily II DNA/RNA helicase
VANKDIIQHVQLVRGHADKTAALLEFLQERLEQLGSPAPTRGSSSSSSSGGGLRVVIFCNTKSGCESLSELLYEEGIK